MAMEALHPQKLNLASIYGTRKSGQRSKPSKGITIKKLNEYRDYNDDGTITKPLFNFESSNLTFGSSSVDDQYELLNEISRGSYGVVHRARDKKTGAIVAIKKEFDGRCVTSLREIKILKNLDRHPSIVEFKKVVVDDRGGVYVVMEYLESNLRRHIKISPRIEAKWLMKQLLEGVKFLHDNAVMHRDLKPSNILMKNVNGFHKLKICDFGLSRHFGGRVEWYTPLVVTLWYRAPELLLGAERYSFAVDMWSVGCIMAELLLKEALFQGKTEIGQLVKIYGILGTPNVKDWPGFSSLPGSEITLIKQPRNMLGNKIPAALLTEVGFDLLSKLLTYNPGKRITAEAALHHDWFKEK